MTPDAYFRTYEYMFVFAKGKLKTANLLHDKPNVRPGAKKERKPTGRTGDSPIKFILSGGVLADTGKRGSVWRYRTLKQDNEPNDLPYGELTFAIAALAAVVGQGSIIPHFAIRSVVCYPATLIVPLPGANGCGG